MTPSLAKIDAEHARQVGEAAEQQAREYLTDTTVIVDISYRATTGGPPRPPKPSAAWSSTG